VGGDTPAVARSSGRRATQA